MKLRVYSSAFALPREERRFVERSLRMALGRHAAGAREARVSFSQDAEDDAALRCRIELRLLDGSPLRIEDHAHDLRTALARAAWRLGRRLEWRGRVAGPQLERGARPAARTAQGGKR